MKNNNRTNSLTAAKLANARKRRLAEAAARKAA